MEEQTSGTLLSPAQSPSGAEGSARSSTNSVCSSSHCCKSRIAAVISCHKTRTEVKITRIRMNAVPSRGGMGFRGAAHAYLLASQNRLVLGILPVHLLQSPSTHSFLRTQHDQPRA